MGVKDNRRYIPVKCVDKYTGILNCTKYIFHTEILLTKKHYFLLNNTKNALMGGNL